MVSRSLLAIEYIFLSMFLISIPDCHCKGVGHSSHSIGSSHTAVYGSMNPASPPVPPPPPPCQAVTASVSVNILRERPCVETDSCVVVVNKRANTTGLCLAWSHYSFWDGSNCVCRCELLGGALAVSSVANTKYCILNGIEFGLYNKSMPGATMYLAPIQCGTWLGARDSAWNKSWFTSDCYSILNNRLENNVVDVSACGVDQYTTGCRWLDTNQRWVPECRFSNVTKCGVKVACPAQNPCGLGPDIDTNLDNTFSNCRTQTHLALNVSADETNCYLWGEHAFLLDGYCVSSCGRLDGQCILDGVSISPCNTVRGFQDGSILSISPEVCSVPMPSDTFTGFRNGFYGMSGVKGSKCLVTPNCTSFFMCFIIEGLSVTPLSYQLSSATPVCNGNLSLRCKIEYPCPIPQEEFRCGGVVLGISQAIWTKMGVYNCDWFKVKDVFIIIFWVISLIWVYAWAEYNNDASEAPLERFNMVGCPSFCVYLIILLVLIGLSCIWEFSLLFVCVGVYLYVSSSQKVNTPSYVQVQQREKLPDDPAAVPMPFPTRGDMRSHSVGSTAPVNTQP